MSNHSDSRIARLVVAAVVLVAASCMQAAVVRSVNYSVEQGISYDPVVPVKVTFEILNNGKAAMDLSSLEYKVTRTRALPTANPADIWKVRFEDVETIAHGTLNLGELKSGAHASALVEFTPGKYGHFMLVLVRGGENLRVAGVAVIRPPREGFQPDSYFMANNDFGLSQRGDYRWLDIAGRLGFKWMRAYPRVRAGPDGTFDFSLADVQFEAFRRNGILMMGDLMGFPGQTIPTLGGKPITYFNGRKANIIPVPEDFGKAGAYVEQLIGRYSDVLAAAVVNNEPWEGGSISNYHATGKYYRDYLAVIAPAAKRANPNFMVLANDQITNLEDNILSQRGCIDLLDATSHHTAWTDTRAVVTSEAYGKPAWETENWQSHVDFEVAANMTMKIARGFVRTTPCDFQGFIHHPGKWGWSAPYYVSPTGQVIATWLNFVDGKRLKKEFWPEALPWITFFEAKTRESDVAVVIGRMKGYGSAYRPDAGDDLFPFVTGNGQLRIRADGVRVFDVSGNVIVSQDGAYSIPLTEEPYYVQADGGLEALENRFLEGQVSYDGPTIDVAFADFTSQLTDGATVNVRVHNAITCRQTVSLRILSPTGWEIEQPEQQVQLEPGEARQIAFKANKVLPSPHNQYAFRAQVTTSQHAWEVSELLAVALIRRGTVIIDGDLADWQGAGAIPVIKSGSPIANDPTEKYWYPFLNEIEPGSQGGLVRFAAMRDKKYFYFCAEVQDAKPHWRPAANGGILYLTHGTPFDFLYWHKPQFPGSVGDAIKIAFDVNRPGGKLDPFLTREQQKKIDTRFSMLNPDYEYDIYAGRQQRLIDPYAVVRGRHLDRLKTPPNPGYASAMPPFEGANVANEGDPVSEVWRLMSPGVPRGNYYPFSPRWNVDQGLVNGALSVVKRSDQGWVYEFAIPRGELATVPDTGEVRFAFYALDGGKRATSWTSGRNLCRSRTVLHPTWQTTPAIETVWGLGE